MDENINLSKSTRKIKRKSPTDNLNQQHKIKNLFTIILCTVILFILCIITSLIINIYIVVSNNTRLYEKKFEKIKKEMNNLINANNNLNEKINELQTKIMVSEQQKNYEKQNYHKRNISTYNKEETETKIVHYCGASHLETINPKLYNDYYINNNPNEYFPLNKDIKMIPLMSNEDIKGFLCFMIKNKTYFEFGSGGSTFIAAYYGLKVYSVETDYNWHKKLELYNFTNIKYITITFRRYEKNSKWKYIPHHSLKELDLFPYVKAYKKSYNADIILLDSCLRVYIALDIYDKIRNDTVVLIHDFKSRTSYKIIEQFYKKIRVWDQLSAFLKIPGKEVPKYLKEQYIRSEATNN